MINDVYSAEDFQAIGLDHFNGNSDQVGTFQTQTGVSYPLCLNADTTRTNYAATPSNHYSFVIDHDGIMRYRGSGVDVNQITSFIDNLIATGINEADEPVSKYSLLQNYPNPFNPSTVIRFHIEKPQKVSLKVFDNQGRLVRTLLATTMHAGAHALSWDGRNSAGQNVSSGTYLYILAGEEFRLSRKMILIR